ncbi:hypothetical protein [Methanomassiliicoccus luminyensis]|uniref:hypothetical protein n=1 Tax=Methanomassiliicoccus luminyensis TaxID=1080712 RepID=UPI0004749B36|nr:hypothetical protein [Methanomassiliicoccus luminyensis]
MSKFNCVNWDKKCPIDKPCSFYAPVSIDEPDLPNLHECPLIKGVQVSFVKVDHNGAPLAEVQPPKAQQVARCPKNLHNDALMMDLSRATMSLLKREVEEAMAAFGIDAPDAYEWVANFHARSGC